MILSMRQIKLGWKRTLADYRNFSIFVAHASKKEKEHILKWAADKAIKEQRKVIAAASLQHRAVSKHVE